MALGSRGGLQGPSSSPSSLATSLHFKVLLPSLTLRSHANPKMTQTTKACATMAHLGGDPAHSSRSYLPVGLWLYLRCVAEKERTSCCLVSNAVRVALFGWTNTLYAYTPKVHSARTYAPATTKMPQQLFESAKANGSAQLTRHTS